MQIKRFPHEFTARWGRNGQLQGYHVVPVDILCDDAGVPLQAENGSNMMETFGVATTLQRAGLDLTELLGEGLQTVLVANDKLHEANVQLTVELAEATGAKAEAEADRDEIAVQLAAANAHAAEQAAIIVALQAELAAAAKAVETP